MTALYGINSINLPHIDLYRWASDKKIFLPINFRKTPEQEQLFLKILAMKQYFVKLHPVLEQARYTEAMKEAMKYMPSNGFSDKTVMIIQIAGVAFLVVISLIASNMNGNAKL